MNYRGKLGMTLDQKVWSLDLPLARHEEVFAACMKTVQNPRHDRLAKLNMRAVERLYNIKASAFKLHTISRHARPKDNEFIDDMVFLYEQKLLGGDARNHYNKILGQNAHCPFCGGMTPVHTLDHVLPKTLYPAFAVLPLNLVPSCRDCNVPKRQRAAEAADQQTLHPYFDNVESTIWLYGTVIRETPPVVSFQVLPSSNLPTDLQERLVNHFESFDLARRFGMHAIKILRPMSRYLQPAFKTEGSAGVKEILRELGGCYPPNSVDGATYNALANDDWYCGGGFEFDTTTSAS